MKYTTILADCPWSYLDRCNAGKRGAEYKYPTMSIEDIKALRVNELAADDCTLFLWGTWPLLQEALDVVKAWCFEYKSNGFIWIKTNKVATDTLFWGMGNGTRQNSEYCLRATKGRPKRYSASVHSVIMSPIEAHSKKPDRVRDDIVKLCGDLPRLEMFARQKVDGWEAIGYDIDEKDIRVAIEDLINA